MIKAFVFALSFLSVVRVFTTRLVGTCSAQAAIGQSDYPQVPAFQYVPLLHHYVPESHHNVLVGFRLIPLYSAWFHYRDTYQQAASAGLHFPVVNTRGVHKAKIRPDSLPVIA